MKKVYNFINLSIEYLMVSIFAILVIDVLAQVFARHLFSNSPSFTEELARYALIWLSILGMAYLSGKREHLTMNFLYRKLTIASRIRVFISIELMIILFAAMVMVIGGGNLVMITWTLDQVSPALHLPLGMIYSIVPLSGLLIIYYAIYNILTGNKNENEK
ncbi:MAG: TRAP transporter small permease [Reichenbachiella sp.]|uniref:TRAP transporter small permease n=1 Tax=Reichenbachiella sp. TaxID=2184521 RepID=UPI003266D682